MIGLLFSRSIRQKAEQMLTGAGEFLVPGSKCSQRFLSTMLSCTGWKLILPDKPFTLFRYIMLICIGCFPIAVAGQLRLPDIFADNMVLQRHRPIHVWGVCAPGDTVAVRFAGQTKNTVTGKDSCWSIYFRKQQTNAVSQTMVVIHRDTTIELKNLLIGDVWICLGQSNMEWPMSREAHWLQERSDADQPLIRFANPLPAGRYVYGVPYADSLSRRLTRDSFYLWSGWQVCDSNTIQPMSAVGYYFARSIVAHRNVPVGLINLSIGGAPIETFVSRAALQNSPQFSLKVQPGNWLENEALPAWPRERAKQNVGDNPRGYGDALGLNHAYKPGFLFECGIEPLLPMAVKGMIWYQGESNAQDTASVFEYRDLFRLMVEDYRKKWRHPDMPVYWVQLSSIDTLHYNSVFWPQFRDGQRISLKEVRNGGMAVSSDIGSRNDVHPTNKKDVGERLARWALYQTYKQDIVPSGPLLRRVRYKNGKLRVQFRYRAEGLSTADGQPLLGFSLDGSTGIEAVIEGKGITIPVSEKPTFVYYGWQPFSDGNLINSEGLPASTFKIKLR